MERRITSALMCVLLLVYSAVRVEPQTEHKLYLPAVIYPPMDGTMGIWSYVEPLGATNLVKDTSFEGTEWAINAGAPTIVGGEGKFGVFAANVALNNNFIDQTDAATITPAASYVLSYWAKAAVAGQTPTARVRFQWRTAVPAVISTVTLDLVTDDDYERVSVVAVAPALSDNVQILVEGTGAQFVNIDAIDIVEGTQISTHIDGDQEGCEWNGAAHGCSSTRSALSRAGGVVTDFQDLNFEISGMIGAGMSPITLNVDRFAILPGGELNSVKTQPRNFTLTGVVTGTSRANMQANREALIEALAPNSVPEQQPIRIRYTGATLTKEIFAYYQAGLEGVISARLDCWELRFALRFLATSPNFFEIGNSAAVLDTEDTATMRIVSGRLRSTGQWDVLGPPGVPGIAVYSNIQAIAVGPDGRIYYGGSFTNFDNQANADFIVAYDPITDTYAPLTTGTDAQVNALAFAPDGTLWAGGNFTAAGGVANTFRVANWDPATSTWTALGAGLDNDVFALAVDLDGDLYIGGDFTDVQGGGGGTFNFIVRWDGAAYNALGVGMDALVGALVVQRDGTLIAGGAFANAGGGAAARIAFWDGAAWSAFGAGANATVTGLVVDAQDNLYACGLFTTMDGVTVNRVAKYNGTAWVSLAEGADATVQRIAFGPDGLLYATGQFTTIGGLTTTERSAKWNGSVWGHLDIDFPGAPGTVRIRPGRADPVIPENYDIWVGFATSGTSAFAGTVDITNEGTEDAFPVFNISRAGGTSARLLSIRNETLGLQLLFDYSLLDGEILTIDLAPTSKLITSSFFGQVQDAVLTASPLGTWRLMPGVNQVTSFVQVAGGPTVVATVEWQSQFWSAD